MQPITGRHIERHVGRNILTASKGPPGFYSHSLALAVFHELPLIVERVDLKHTHIYTRLNTYVWNDVWSMQNILAYH